MCWLLHNHVIFAFWDWHIMLNALPFHVFIASLNHFMSLLLLLMKQVNPVECILGVKLSCHLCEAVDFNIVNVLVRVLHSALGNCSPWKITRIKHVLQRPILRLLEIAVDVAQVTLS